MLKRQELGEDGIEIMLGAFADADFMDIAHLDDATASNLDALLAELAALER